jgi:hypothetical protein
MKWLENYTQIICNFILSPILRVRTVDNTYIDTKLYEVFFNVSESTAYNNYYI